MTNGKRESVGWMGPSKGPATSRGKGRWRVIDSHGQRIASGFTTRAYALRWIDGFNLMRAGYQLSNDDLKWIFLHWHSALPARQDPERHAPTESRGNANVPTSSAEDDSGTEGVAAAGHSRNKDRVQVCPFLPGADETRQPATVKRDQGQCMSPFVCDGRENVTRNGVATHRV